MASEPIDKVQGAVDEGATDYLSGRRFKPAVNSQTALKLSTVYRCVEVLSNSVAQLPVAPYNAETKSIMREHPAYGILAIEPNRRMTRYTFFKQIVQDILLNGNAYAYIERDAHNLPVQLIYIPAGFVSIIHPGNVFGDIKYTVAGVSQIVEHTDMLHFLNLSKDGVTGLSTIYYAAQSLGLSIESEESAGDHLSHNITGLLSTDMNQADEQLKRAKRAWNKSVKEEGSIAVLSGGWRYQSVSVNARDSQLIESREFNSVDIARWFGVPTTKLGINKGVSYNGIEAEQLAYLSDTLHPLLQRLECELERKLFNKAERQTVDVRFDISSILRTDLKSKAEYYRTLFNIGAMTINEIRNDLDMQSVEHGDETYLQTNMTTIANIIHNKITNTKQDV